MQNIRYPIVKSENDRVWNKYCGFLDLSLQQFMAIQEALLLHHLEAMAYCPLGRKLIGSRTPASIEEYRHLVPLTTYEDYLPELVQRRPPRMNASDEIIRELVGSGSRQPLPVARS